MVAGRNPWVSRPALSGAEAAEADASLTPAADALHSALRATGPVTPQAGVPAPPEDVRLPVSSAPGTADLWLVGTHGGAGESTLAGLVEGWRAANHAWPAPPAHGSVANVVLISRSNARGLTSARAAATQWASGLVPHARVLGLVLVADAPKEPRPLRPLMQLVAGGVPRLWRVPWFEPWRLGASPELATAPREARRLVDELRALIQEGVQGAPYRKEDR